MGVAAFAVVDAAHKAGSWIAELPMTNGPAMHAVCGGCHDYLGPAAAALRCGGCGLLFCRACAERSGGGGGGCCCSTTESSDLGIQPIYGCRGLVQFHAGGAGKDGLLVSPERVPESPASKSGSGCRLSSPIALRCSIARSVDYEDSEDFENQYFSPQSEFSQDTSDTDSISMISRNESDSFNCASLGPLDSALKRLEQGDKTPISTRNGLFDQGSPSYPRHLYVGSDVVDSAYDSTSACNGKQYQEAQQLIDFESNKLIWLPPPPEDEGDDLENGFFEYEDDDIETECSDEIFKHGSYDDEMLGIKGRPTLANKELLRKALDGHFRALVSQLLQGHGVSHEDRDGWLDIVSSLAWQAANFVKPDTSKGGSMDPADYVKVKCIASGNPKDSTFIKGVVCSKNVKHKRMVSQHRNPRLLLLRGALEYQKVSNSLASINSVLEQEKEYLKNAVAKIEAYRPHVLLVEKSVPLYAQQLLAKDVSLVLNVKRPLLERISRCTGAQIASSIETLASVRLGQCQMFRIERAIECSSPKNSSKKSVKTLMFFEGCPRRLGCTVLLRGPCQEELKKVKLAVQFAVFAAYHLSLETSFLADEGATLPKIPSRFSAVPTEKHMDAENHAQRASSREIFNALETKHLGKGSRSMPAGCPDPSLKSLSEEESLYGRNSEQKECISLINDIFSPRSSRNNGCAPSPDLKVWQEANDSFHLSHFQNDAGIHHDEMVDGIVRQESNLDNDCHHRSDEYNREVIHDQNGHHNDYFPTADPRSILVSLSIACPLRGMLCKQSQLFRIKFYGCFDKPLGRYFREDIFDQTSCCPSCKEPAEAHVRCYTHHQGSLTISVRKLTSVKLPGEHDGKIWMWHRCLRCKQKDGIPPATHRVVMSNAARGLSFGKFLELSFSNHTTANRIASCGHSLQRDCLRFYGFGSMVAVFRYSPVDVLSVNLPPSVLNFAYPVPQEWIRKEAVAISSKKECLHMKILDTLDRIERIISNSENGTPKAGICKNVVELKDLIKVESEKYDVVLKFENMGNMQTLEPPIDILELYHLRWNLIVDAYTWDRRLYMLDSLTKENCYNTSTNALCSEKLSASKIKEWKPEFSCKDDTIERSLEQTQSSSLTQVTSSRQLSPPRQQEDTSSKVFECNTSIVVEMDLSLQSIKGYLGSAGLNLAVDHCRRDDEGLPGDEAKTEKSLGRSHSDASSLSEKIDLAWIGSDQLVKELSNCGVGALSVRPFGRMDNPSFQKAVAPIRIESFDSAICFRNRLQSIDDPKANMRRAYSQKSNRAFQRMDSTSTETFISSLSASAVMGDEGRLLLPQNGSDVVVAIYDEEPSSMIAHAMTSLEYSNFLSPAVHQHDKLDRIGGTSGQMMSYTTCMNSMDQEYTCKSRLDGTMSWSGSDQSQLLMRNILDSEDSHVTVSFDDENSFSAEKAKFSVTCYFAKQFDALRKKCCPNELDYIRSLSRCKRWSARGGKSSVYFAKTLDDRFIIKQVTRTELDSFEDFAPEYFKYLTESLTSGSPTSLAKVLGLYQVVAKNLKGGKELKMDVMVMENLFFQREVSRIYDLKGSLRSRYNPDTSGNNKVLLDLNLLETLHTKPIFLGSKAKRRLERAVWNDTSFLALVDVMDYSLLVGIDEERKEIVIGIIDFLRQYTWDKQLETWVKASGILGGPKNTPPTIISPIQYKKRFRKAMSKYFLTVPDQWSS